MRRLPAEWEPQAAVMLTWPHAGTDWAVQLEAVEAVYRRLAQLITAQQGLLVVCRDAGQQSAVAHQLAGAAVELERVRFALAPSNDTWARDHGPITVLDDGQPVVVDFRFNGWGGKHAAELDDRITPTVFAAGGFAQPDRAWPEPLQRASAQGRAQQDGGLRLESSSLVLEGGAIESDGAGTLLAVRRTLLDPARNPDWSLNAIEHELRARLGVTRMLWLEHGQLSGDDTDGHVDTLVRFCDRGTLCYAAGDDPTDADYASLAGLADELQALRQANGMPYRLVPLPQPAPIIADDGQRLPAGYANFSIINRAVLVPVYRDPADALACARLQACFPGRRIEPVDCRPLIRQGGSLHCITMQVPAGG